MPVNFTDQEWKEYIEKVKQIKPLNDKEWEEYDRQLQSGNENPNYDFYPHTDGYSPKRKPISKQEPIPKQKPIQSIPQHDHFKKNIFLCFIVFIGIILGSIWLGFFFGLLKRGILP